MWWSWSILILLWKTGLWKGSCDHIQLVFFILLHVFTKHFHAFEGSSWCICAAELCEILEYACQGQLVTYYYGQNDGWMFNWNCFFISIINAHFQLLITCGVFFSKLYHTTLTRNTFKKKMGNATGKPAQFKANHKIILVPCPC